MSSPRSAGGSDVRSDGGDAPASALRVEGMSVAYGDLVAVHEVSFAVDPGEVVALFGRNGAGKTSSLMCITGTLPARRGSIHLFGRDITRVPVAARIGQGLACVQEGRHIFRGLSVAQNLQLGLYSARLGRRARASTLAETYERFPILGQRRDSIADRLSGGQQQILAIAQAIMPKPKVLLLDEPSAGLAPSVLSDIMTVVGDLKNAGLAIVLVEQLVDQALKYADRVVILDGGRVVHSGSARDEGAFDVARSVYLARKQQ